MSSSSSFTGADGAQRVLANRALWHGLFAGSVSAGRCVVALFVCPALITAAAFLTFYTLLWWRWSQMQVESPLNWRIFSATPRFFLKHINSRHWHRL
jgi:hypothetical protein